MSTVAKELVERACPGCGSRRHSTRPQAASRPPAETLSLDHIFRHLDQFSSYWENSKGRRVFFSFYRCNDCGLLYCPMTFAPDQLEKIYHRLNDNSHGLAQPVLERIQKGYFELLHRYSDLQGDYIEIGPDVGLFTRLCAQQGGLRKLYLFEPNTTVQSRLEENTAGMTREIHSRIFDVAAVPEASVSMAVAIHVADHLLEPGSFLASLRTRLVASGVLFLVVHDERSLLARLSGALWPPYNMCHPQLYNARTISALLERAGFQVLAVEKTYNYFPASDLIESAVKLVGARSLRLAFLNRLTLKIKIGNIAVIAKKPST